MRHAALSSKLFLALCAAITSGAAQAQNAADHFRGKTISVLVGFGPGGGYDGYGQLLGQYIGKFIPGEPRVVVKHMPGAGSVAMMNHIYNVAPKDGLTFGIPAAGVAFTHLIGTERDKAAAKYDARKFSWLGSLEAFTPITFAWHKTRFRTLEDLRQHEFNYGSSGPTTGGENYAEMMNNLLGTKLRPVRGYKGSNEIALAIERGELDGIVGWCWTCVKADKPQYITDKTGIFITQFAVKPDPEMSAAGVPNFLDLVKNSDDRKAAQLVLANLAFGRPFAGPPDLPPYILQALRKAFIDMTKDKEFMDFAQKTRRVINLMTGEEIDKLLDESFALPKEIVERAIRISAPPP